MNIKEYIEATALFTLFSIIIMFLFFPDLIEQFEIKLSLDSSLFIDHHKDNDPTRNYYENQPVKY